MTYELLNKYILNYLENNKTNSAIMLSGGWGTGKSYYVQHTLKPYIKERGKDCVVVSLYGIKELSEISKAIYMELRMKKISEKLDNEVLKTGWVAVKTIVKGVSGYFGVDLSRDEESLKSLYNSIDLSGKLIVLDDIERSGIDIFELLGYINNLVEQDGIKVLLVCNEDELLKEDPEKVGKEDKDSTSYTKIAIPNYKEKKKKEFLTYDSLRYLEIKEKTVSDTIQFECDLKEAIKSIIGLIDNDILSRFSDEATISDVIRHYQSDNYNLRSFLFACQKTSDIFNGLAPDIDNEDFLKSIFLGICNFSYKIKSGEEPYWNGNEYYSLDYSFEKYPLFRFCYDYILEQNLNLDTVPQCIEHFNIMRMLEVNAQSIEGTLSVLDNYYYYTENDVFKALSELEEALKTSINVSFYSYGKIIGNLIAFRKIMDYDYSNIKELMKANLAQFSDDVDVRSLFRFGTFIDDVEEKQWYDEFVDELKETIRNNSTSIFDFDYKPENVIVFSNNVIKHSDKYLTDGSFAAKLDIDKLFELMTECNSQQVDEIRGMFIELYRPGNIKDFLSSDLESLIILKEKVEKYVADYKGDRIFKQHFVWFIDNLNSIIRKLQR